MERGVEHGDLRLAGHEFLDGLDAHQVGRVVERCQLAAAADLVHHVGGHPHAAGEKLAAVCHAVANGFDAVERIDNAFFRIHQGVEHDFDAGGMVGDFGFADAFDKALFHEGEIFGAPHVKQLIFQRGASAVQDKNDHIILLFEFVNQTKLGKIIVPC